MPVTVGKVVEECHRYYKLCIVHSGDSISSHLRKSDYVKGNRLLEKDQKLK